MTDFLVNNSIYVVLIVALVVLAGPIFYLFGIDMRLRRLEKQEAE